MTTKKIAAIIVAALVAGVVLGTMGIANAGGKVSLPGAPASDCASCPGEAVPAAAAAQGGCPDGAVCGEAPAAAAAPVAVPQAGCPDGSACDMSDPAAQGAAAPADLPVSQ